MLNYYKKQPDGRYCKVIVDDTNHSGTTNDPYKVVDAYFITRKQYKNEIKGKGVIYIKPFKLSEWTKETIVYINNRIRKFIGGI